MTTTQTVPYRPLGILKTLMENLGFEVSHCYEDLVFLAHNAFLLRMEDKGEKVSLLFNMDSDPGKRHEISELLAAEGKKHHLIISSPGTYRITANEGDDTINLEFHEETE